MNKRSKSNLSTQKQRNSSKDNKSKSPVAKKSKKKVVNTKTTRQSKVPDPQTLDTRNDSANLIPVSNLTEHETKC